MYAKTQNLRRGKSHIIFEDVAALDLGFAQDSFRRPISDSFHGFG